MTAAEREAAMTTVAIHAPMVVVLQQQKQQLQAATSSSLNCWHLHSGMVH
jgi:hypothetical protein